NCAGRVIASPVSGVDLPPTFFAQAGLELPWTMHGHDLSPLFAKDQTSWKHPAMLVHTAKSYGSATAKIPSKDDPALYHGPGIPWYVMLSEGRYKYIRNLIEGETEELYDIISDPDELVNKAHEPNLKKTLKKFRSQTVGELRRTKAEFIDKLPSVAAPSE
ncbi:MAG: sulfatase, partial [Akkermansiaceae bacterium]